MKKIFLIILLIFITGTAFINTQAHQNQSVLVVERVSKNTHSKTPINNIYFITAILILTLINYLIWFKYGKDEIVIPVVNFYPPQNINPLEAEFAYKGLATKRGIGAYVIYLASKGFLEIKEDKKGEYTIKRIKDYNISTNLSDVEMLKALFPFDFDVVTKFDLQTSYIFHDTSERMINKLNNHKEVIFFKETVNNSWLIFMIFCLLVLITLALFYIHSYNYQLIKLFFCLTCIIISSVCTYQLPKRNNVGNRILGKLLGLKKFIEVAKKQEIQKLVEENPNYFYDILPYAYVLDVTNTWIKKFENISIIDPKWEANNKFYSYGNIQSINNILKILNSNVTPY